MWLRVHAERTVIVPDYRGAPYLRFSASGIDVNHNSEMYYLNQTPIAETPPWNLTARTPPTGTGSAAGTRTGGTTAGCMRSRPLRFRPGRRSLGGGRSRSGSTERRARSRRAVSRRQPVDRLVLADRRAARVRARGVADAEATRSMQGWRVCSGSSRCRRGRRARPRSCMAARGSEHLRSSSWWCWSGSSPGGCGACFSDTLATSRISRSGSCDRRGAGARADAAARLCADRAARVPRARTGCGVPRNRDRPAAVRVPDGGSCGRGAPASASAYDDELDEEDDGAWGLA